ncbi:hypothetical protein BDB00DRAFT_854261 [Zychaea mexicana]|uniref:uncharacterized protein n=1 Tax=Zychaea mexicana TaxID=64656 RepID=UPI0022FEA41A|nr:uncharacterized protein BDB00DRAFT_854261 [Zychaea mexicana]KAI9484611.1 hypothetical protein BDB00DRAFT_854261 [Zychaea mexicana]
MENSRRLRVSIMDSPAGYVTRLLHMNEYEIPVKAASIVTDLFNMMKTVLKAKAIAIESIKQIEKHQEPQEKSSEPGYSFQQSSSKQLYISPSLYFTTTNKKQKKT